MVTLSLKLRFLCVAQASCCHAFFVRIERGILMPDYEQMYFALFNKISDVIEELKEIQLEMEEKYIDQKDED